MLMRFLKDRLEAHRAEQRYRETDSDWAAMRTAIQMGDMCQGAPRRLIIVPSDPWTLTGAKGDEAMIQSVVSQLRAVSPDLHVGIITGSEVASGAARQLGFEPIQVWRQPLQAVVDAITAFKADGLAVLGADCMDGYYSADTTLCLLALADVASRLGIRSTILGFSFNDQPAPRLSSAFNAVNSRVAINVRDEVSLQRLNKFCTAQAQLVTDSAFMLIPVTDSRVVKEAFEWAQGQRAQGRQVIGFNAHPMLIKNPTPDQLTNLFETVAAALKSFMDSADVSVALISHDYRGSSGDDACLKPIAEMLQPRFGDRLYYRETKCSASELKGIAGTMDGVVTGRMHLAIASLGMGVPVAALTYQDKFQGLMRHFQLPQDLLLAPEQLVGPDPLVSLLRRFTKEIATHRAQVEQRLPVVKQMSAQNVRVLLA